MACGTKSHARGSSCAVLDWFPSFRCRLAGNEDSAAEAGSSQEPDEAAVVASPPARLGLAEVLDELPNEATTGNEPGPSSSAMSPSVQSTGTQSAAGHAPESADGLPQATLCTPEQPQETKPTGLLQHFIVASSTTCCTPGLRPLCKELTPSPHRST